MTAYMWNSWEKAKIIEAQWCANAIWWELKNYVYNALTSKNLKTGDNYVSPEYYYIDLITPDADVSTCNKYLAESNNFFCDKIKLWYHTWTISNLGEERQKIQTYKTINADNTCHIWKSDIRFYWSWLWGGDFRYIRMNKWFTPKEVNEKKVFFIKDHADDDIENTKILMWDIIVVLCYNKECTTWKHIGKFHIDARSQTIEFQKCKFYKEEEPTRCKTREWETDDEV